MTSHQQALIDFAEATLEILEEHEEWSADTTDDIAQQAIVRNLATTENPEMLFRRVKETPA